MSFEIDGDVVSSRIIGSVGHGVGTVVVVNHDWSDVSLWTSDLDVEVIRGSRVAGVEQVDCLDGKIGGKELFSLLETWSTRHAISLFDRNREGAVSDGASVEGDRNGVSSRLSGSVGDVVIAIILVHNLRLDIRLATANLDAEFVIGRRNASIIESTSINAELGWEVLLSLFQTAS